MNVVHLTAGAEGFREAGGANWVSHILQYLGIRLCDTFIITPFTYPIFATAKGVECCPQQLLLLLDRCVLVKAGKVIARGSNRTNELRNVRRHIPLASQTIVAHMHFNDSLPMLIHIRRPTSFKAVFLCCRVQNMLK